jgi:hypothetical protein
MFTTVSVVFTQRANGGRHVWDVKPELRSYAVLCMWLAQFSFLICSGCTKVSILFFYRRLVSGTYSKKWYWCVWFAIGFTIVYTVAFCIMLLIDCRPTRAYWMAFDIKYALTADYTCLKDSNVINTTAGVCAAISDLYAVALPCIITWHHAVPRRQRVALNAIFCLGFVVVGASGVRTYWLISKCRRINVTGPSSSALLLISHHSDQQLTRRHPIRLHALRLGPIRAAGGNHVRFRTSPPRLLPSLPRRQPSVPQ